MSTNPQFQSSNNLYGFPQPLTRVFPPPILSQRVPTTADYKYPIGQVWIDEVGENSYTLVNVTAASATWNLTSSTPGTINTLTGDSGGAISPSGANITLAGTANQITTTGAGSTITWSLPAAITAPGSLTTTTTLASGTTLTAGSSLAVTTSATIGTTLGVTGTTTLAALNQVGITHINISGGALTTIGTGGTGAVQIGNATGNTAVTGSLTASTTLTATLGNITATNGNVVLGTAGNKLNSTSVGTTTAAGANSFGSVALVGGTATVATTSVTANSLIFLTCQALGTVIVPSALCVSAKTASTSFVITASQATDTSTIAWFIVN